MTAVLTAVQSPPEREAGEELPQRLAERPASHPALKRSERTPLAVWAHQKHPAGREWQIRESRRTKQPARRVVLVRHELVLVWEPGRLAPAGEAASETAAHVAAAQHARVPTQMAVHPEPAAQVVPKSLTHPEPAGEVARMVRVRPLERVPRTGRADPEEIRGRGGQHRKSGLSAACSGVPKRHSRAGCSSCASQHLRPRLSSIAPAHPQPGSSTGQPTGSRETPATHTA